MNRVSSAQIDAAACRALAVEHPNKLSIRTHAFTAVDAQGGPHDHHP